MSDDLDLGYSSPEFVESISRLSNDLRNASVTLSDQEARFLVDAYYAIQGERIRSNNQIKALDKSQEPHVLTNWFFEQRGTLEKQIARALDRFSASKVPGVWARSVVGVGPVIAAGLLAHIDISKGFESVGKLWRYSGLDPTIENKKGVKRVYNTSLKVLCAFKLGESFVKTCNNENSVYGKIYKERKELEIARNESGKFADQAKTILETKKFNHATEAYKAYSVGKLPPAHIHARARRYAVKLFVSHYHYVCWELHYGVPPAKPIIFTRPEHTHYILPPNWPLPASEIKKMEKVLATNVARSAKGKA